MFVSSFGYGTSKREGMEARHKGIRPLVRSPHTERQRRLLLLSLFLTGRQAGRQHIVQTCLVLRLGGLFGQAARRLGILAAFFGGRHEFGGNRRRPRKTHIQRTPVLGRGVRRELGIALGNGHFVLANRANGRLGRFLDAHHAALVVPNSQGAIGLLLALLGGGVGFGHLEWVVSLLRVCTC